MSDADDDALLAAVEAMLTAGMAEGAELLREANAEVVETGYDNRIGGSHLYTVFSSAMSAGIRTVWAYLNIEKPPARIAANGSARASAKSNGQCRDSDDNPKGSMIFRELRYSVYMSF
jgi:hypothetical protein